MLKIYALSFRLSPSQIKLKGMELKSLKLHHQEKSTLYSNSFPRTCRKTGFYFSVKASEN